MLMDVETYPLPAQTKRLAIMMRAAEIERPLPRYALMLDEAEAAAEYQRLVSLVTSNLKAALPLVVTSAKPVAAVVTGKVATPWKQLPLGPHATGKQSTGCAGPRQSAERFLSWLLATGHTGNHSSSDMAAFYREFRAINPRENTPENILREHLGQLQPWVNKVQSYKRVKGQRVRPVVWEIGKAENMRRAA